MVINRYMCSLLLSAFYFSFLCTAGNDVKQKSITLAQHVCDEARKHTSPELAACKTLKCVEDLLYTEEKSALDKVFKEHNPWITHKLFENNVQSSRWWNMQWRKMSAWMTQHDKKTLGSELVESTKKMLIKHDIDPQNIDIGNRSLIREFLEGNISAASASANGIAFNKNIRSAIDADQLNWVIAHEVTHVKEDHSLKQECLNNLLSPMDRDGTIHNAYILNSPSMLQFQRSQEKQADLFPLVRLNDVSVNNGAHKYVVPHCINDYLKGDLKSKWNQSSPTKTHPECSELLPYMMKIADLKKNGAVPLYEKAHKTTT